MTDMMTAPMEDVIRVLAEFVGGEIERQYLIEGNYPLTAGKESVIL